eukprot:s855_g16.t1
MARHKGSVFGALGEEAQPSSEQLRNDLAIQWSKLCSSKWVYLEELKPAWGVAVEGQDTCMPSMRFSCRGRLPQDEGARIGEAVLPSSLYQRLRGASLVLHLDVAFALRATRSLELYGRFGAEAVQRAGAARDVVDQGGGKKQKEILRNYDKAYDYHLNRGRRQDQILRLEVSTLNCSAVAHDAVEVAAAREATAPEATASLPSGQSTSRAQVREARCFCGAVITRATGDPAAVSICHCSICRRLSGAPFVASAIFLPQRAQDLSETHRGVVPCPRGLAPASADTPEPPQEDKGGEPSVKGATAKAPGAAPPPPPPPVPAKEEPPAGGEREEPPRAPAREAPSSSHQPRRVAKSEKPSTTPEREKKKRAHRSRSRRRRDHRSAERLASPVRPEGVKSERPAAALPAAGPRRDRRGALRRQRKQRRRSAMSEAKGGRGPEWELLGCSYQSRAESSGTPHEDGLIHVRRMRHLGEAREDWMTNLVPPERHQRGHDELAELRADQELHPPRTGEEAKRPDRSSESPPHREKDKKKRKRSRSRKKRGVRPKLQPTKELTTVFGGTGADPDPKVRKFFRKRAAKLAKRKLKESSSGSSGMTDSSSSSASGEHALFGSSNRVRTIGKKYPGVLLSAALEEASDSLITQEGGVFNTQGGALPPLFTRYFRQQLMGRMSPAMRREAQTLSYLLDLALRGRITESLDVAAQRLKSLEMMSAGSHFTVTQQTELLPKDDSSLATLPEFTEAARRAREDGRARLDASRPYGSRGAGGGRSEEWGKGSGKKGAPKGKSGKTDQKKGDGDKAEGKKAKGG